MMKIDKSSEIDVTAALLKLKQKEQVGWNTVNFPIYNLKRSLNALCLFKCQSFDMQEIERKDRKQFKGLFD